MFKISCFLMLIVFPGFVIAQTFDEWFKQKKTQKKYLVKQIALLETYSGYLEKGFKIVQAGSALISDLKKGEFDIHSLSMESLSLVNTAISDRAQVSVIQTKCSSAILASDRSFKECRNSGGFSKEEINSIQTAHRKINEKFSLAIFELKSMITDNDFKMTDDERIKNIDRVKRSIDELINILRSYDKENILLMQSRKKERSNLELMKKLHTQY